MLQRRGRAPGERGRIDLHLHLPLHAGLRTRHRIVRRRRRPRGREHGRDLLRERVDRQDRDVRRRLRGSRTGERVQRLEENVGRRHEHDARDAERDRLRALARDERNGVARLCLQRRGELLVEDDLAGLQRAAQEPERVEVLEVIQRHGEDRPVSGRDRAGGRDVRHARERCRCDRGGLEHIGLLRDSRCGTLRGGVRAHRRLPVDRDAAHRAAGHRLKRVPDEEDHRAEQRDRGREREDTDEGAAGRAHKADERQTGERDHSSAGLSTIRPS